MTPTLMQLKVDHGRGRPYRNLTKYYDSATVKPRAHTESSQNVGHVVAQPI